MIAQATYGRKTDPSAEQSDAAFAGLNQRMEPDKVQEGYVCSATNVRMRSGVIEPRLGLVKPGWLNVTAPGVSTDISPVTDFYGSGVFRDPDDREWVLVAADGSVARCREHNCKYTLPLPEGVKLVSRVSFVQAFNKVFCFRGKHLAPLVMSDVDAGFKDLVPHWASITVYKAAVVTTGQVAQEISYGPTQIVSALTSVGDVATAVTATAHGYVTGADIEISGANETGYNGRWNITVVDEVTFTYQFGGAASPATGTVLCSNNSNYWKAAGSVVTLTTLTHSGTTATATKNGHGFSNSQYVTISGATPAGYNGTYLISGVAANTFQYTMAADPGADATGTITAQTSVVLAGQDPETHPAAWTQIYNMLPNADDALYINNRLLVPTAYTPGATDYDSTSVYTKKDFIVATDVLDELHFDFQNEFRINQGSDDEIVCLVKYGPGTAIVFKGKSWGVLSNIGVDLSNLTLDMRQDNYGAAAVRSATVAGADIIFPVTKRGIVSVMQNALGQLRSQDVPLSNEIEGQPGSLISRINWNYGDQIRLTYWDDKVYCAVPLDDAEVRGNDMVPAGAVYGETSGALPYALTVAAGGKYYFDAGSHSSLFGGTQTNGWLVNGTDTITASGDFVAQGSTVLLYRNATGRAITGLPGVTVAVETAVYPYIQGVNNAVLVYDMRCRAWQGADVAQGFAPMEWFKAVYNGQERLFCISADGYVNMLEESENGDELGSNSGLTMAAIETELRSRGFTFDNTAHKRFRMIEVVMGVLNCSYTISSRTAAASSDQERITDRSYSRLTYERPFDREPYVDGNVNGDFAEAGRLNYAVMLPAAGGLHLDSGTVVLDVFQEVRERISAPNVTGRYIQVTVSNNSGRCKVRSITPLASEGQRRAGRFI